MEAPKEIAHLLHQASRDGMLLSEEDAINVWRELICAAAIYVPEKQKVEIR
jgi:hypothetical protein